jgi:hypothetical protein
VTGLPTSNRITLSTNIVLQYQGEIGIFSGYGRVVIHQGYEAYDIRLPSGQVTYLGFTQYLPHNYSDSWAYWGVAEYLGGNLYVLFADYSFPVSTIDRARLPDGEVSRAAGFIDFSDMASFIISPSLSRWFFHYQGHGQVGGTTETLGSAKVLYSTDPQFPFIYNEPVSQSVYPGSNATLVVSAGGGYPLYYQWQWNGTNLASATNETFSITDTVATQAGAYQVLVTNVESSVTSAVAYLTVLVPPQITTQPQAYVVAQGPGGTNRYIPASVVMEGTNVEIEVNASGTPPLFYQWRFNGNNIDGATNRIYSIGTISTNQTGGYKVIVSNIAGTVTSFNAWLRVQGVVEIG